MLSNPLILLIGVPTIAGGACLFMPDRAKWLARTTAFLVTVFCLAASIFVFMKKPLIWQNGQTALLTADNLSAFMGIGIAAFAFLITIYSFGFIEKKIGRYFGYVLFTLGGSFGVVFANDLVALLIFWGFLAVMLYLLVNVEGTDRASTSAKKAMIVIGGTDAVMLLGIALIWSIAGTFSMDKINIPLNGALPIAAFVSLAIASFAKAGAIPFHSWLPDVAEDGPAPVTAYLPASLDKLLGIYLLARCSLSLFAMNGAANLFLALVGSATIVLAVMIALVQHDFKRLLGYHAVSQVGYMILGIGTGTAIGMAGGLFHMINHAIYKSCLFLSAGNVEKKTGTTDLSKLGGLAGFMPITFACFLVAALSISGIPPFNGFVSKWMVYQGVIESASPKNPLWIVWLSSAMFGSALTLASFMKLLHAVFLGRAAKDFGNIDEVGFSMSFPIAVLAVLCFVFGVFAFILPIRAFIMPAVGTEAVYLGVWNPIIATVLIVIGIVTGLFIYVLMGRKRDYRTVATFVGGEDTSVLERVSGAEFYDTIKETKALKTFYKNQKAGEFDIYDQGKNLTSFFSGVLQHLHNGILPTYLVWCLLGMIALFLTLFWGKIW